MANPFKEAEKAKKKPAGKPQEAVETKETVVEGEETPVVEEKPVEAQEMPVTAKKEEKPVEKAPKKETKAAKPAADIFAGLTAEKSAAKTHAFYLSDDNVDKLKKRADKMGISASKLLDHILSEVL